MGKYEDNKAVVIGSPVLGKAVIQEKGKFEIILVFQKSTRHEFYWVFSAESVTAPRRAWKFVNYYGLDATRKYHSDFGSFVRYYADLKAGSRIVSINVFHPARMAAILVSPQQETVVGNWEAQDLTDATFEIVGDKFKKSAFGTGYWFNNRNRAFDTLPTKSNAVLLFPDFCDVCGQNHAVAHFPDGKKKCIGFDDLNKNPGLRYAGHKDGIFKFEFTIDRVSA